ncbi:ATP-grasp domain-containing protein [Candidatus Woesearchaeota archaeon]|nr:ATP-grasp domain-containing protein [Candidatus Woesearchaeota archaeon]
MDILFVNSSGEKTSHFLPAKRMGHKIILVKDSPTKKDYELFDQVIDCDLFDEERVLSLLPHVDACLTRFEPNVPLVGYICDKLGLVGPSLDATLNARDKLRMREVLLQAGIPQPKFFAIRSVSDAYTAAKKLGYPFIIKPISGAKSRYIKKVTCYEEIEPFFNIVYDGCNENGGDLFQNFKTIQDNDFRLVFLAEECIIGKQITTTTVVSKGVVKHLCVADLITGQDIGVDAFYLISRTQPSRMSSSEQSNVLDVCTRAIKALGLDNTAVHPEFIYTSDGPKVLEIAARIGGYRTEMTREAFGIKLNEIAIKIALGEDIDFTPLFTKASSAVEVWPLTSGIVQTEIEKKYDTVEFKVKKKVGDRYDVPPVGEFPVCNFVVTALTPIEAESKAKEIMDDILSNLKIS